MTLDELPWAHYNEWWDKVHVGPLTIWRCKTVHEGALHTGPTRLGKYVLAHDDEFVMDSPYFGLNASDADPFLLQCAVYELCKTYTPHGEDI